MAGRKKEKSEEIEQEKASNEVATIIQKQNEVIAKIIESQDKLSAELKEINQNFSSLTDQLTALGDKISTGGFSLFGRK